MNSLSSQERPNDQPAVVSIARIDPELPRRCWGRVQRLVAGDGPGNAENLQAPEPGQPDVVVTPGGWTVGKTWSWGAAKRVKARTAALNPQTCRLNRG